MARERRRVYKKAWRAANPEIHKATKARWHSKYPEKSMLARARQRAAQHGLPFSITASDIHIPIVCPVLGIPLRHNCGGGTIKDGSPTLDRVIPALGYIPGNVCVISSRANRIKNDGSADEIMAVYRYTAKRTRPADQADAWPDPEDSVRS